MSARHLFLLIILLFLAAPASAQFTISTVEPGTELRMPMKVYYAPVEVDVVNEAKAKMIRKAVWRQRNLVDTKVTLTGWLTQYNKAWSSNGGQNSISGQLLIYYYHTFEKNRFTNIFKFDGQYGMNYLDDIWFKNQDLLKLYELASWKLKRYGHLKNWAYSFSTTFMSQFAEGYKSRKEKDILWSNFLAPAILNGGIGLTYTSPNAKLPFIITLEPISGNVLFVNDGRLSLDRRRALGIPVSYADDDTEQQFPIYKNYKAEGGSNMKISFIRTFKFGRKQNFTMQYNTTISSFYGWITEVARHDVNGGAPEILPTLDWTNTLNINPMKFLTLQFSMRMMYDKSQIDKIQMQYFMSVGVSYTFKNK